MKHDHDDGLQRDLHVLAQAIERRRFLGWLGALAAAPLLACAGEGSSAANSANGGGDSEGDSDDDSTSGSCSQIPEETAGPYPGDGSNGPNVLALSGIVRSDIRSSFAGLSGTAQGVPLTIKLTIVNSVGSCEPVSGYAVYLWHCDAAGQYSMYSITDQNYLRGVQETDDKGQVTFTSVFPACYDGRWPHVHFEVYPSLDSASSSANKIATSQFAFPKETCDVVYQQDGYAQSVSNLSRVSLTSDNIFSDGVSLQMPKVSGNVKDGYVVELTVAVGEEVTQAAGAPGGMMGAPPAR